MEEARDAATLIEDGKLALQERNLEAAKELFQLAISRIERERGEVVELVKPLYLFAQAVSRGRPWNVFPPEERQALERALMIAEKTAGSESPIASRIHETLAVCLHAGNEALLAIPHMRRAVHFKELHFGAGLALAHALTGLASMLEATDDYAGSEELHARAFEMAGNRGEELMDFTCNFGRGRCWLLLGDPERARPFLDAAYKRCVDKYGPDGRGSVELRSWLGRLG